MRTKQRGKSSHGNVTYFYLDLPSGQILKDPAPDKLQYSCINKAIYPQDFKIKDFQVICFHKSTYKRSHNGQLKISSNNKTDSILWDPHFDRRNQYILNVIANATIIDDNAQNGQSCNDVTAVQSVERSPSPKLLVLKSFQFSNPLLRKNTPNLITFALSPTHLMSQIL